MAADRASPVDELSHDAARAIAARYFAREVMAEGAVGQGVSRDGTWVFPVYFGYARKEAPDPILVDKRTGAASWAGLEAHRAFMEKMKRR